MPWGAPIGSGQGLVNTYALRTLRERITDVPLVIDAGIGSPKDAVQAMEMGFDAVLLNSAVSNARDPVLMAEAFRLAIESGHKAHRAGIIAKQDLAVPTTPVTGLPFLRAGTVRPYRPVTHLVPPDFPPIGPGLRWVCFRLRLYS